MPTKQPRTRSVDADKFVVRLQTGQRARVEKLAVANSRSMNQEIVMALRWWLDCKEAINLQLELLTRELGRLQLSDSPSGFEGVLDAIVRAHPETSLHAQAIKHMLGHPDT